MVPECVALDVHKRSITASYVGSDTKTWKFPTTREKIVNELKQYGNIPVVLEASTSGKAVASLLIAEGRELHMAAPNKVGTYFPQNRKWNFLNFHSTART